MESQKEILAVLKKALWTDMPTDCQWKAARSIAMSVTQGVTDVNVAYATYTARLSKKESPLKLLGFKSLFGELSKRDNYRVVHMLNVTNESTAQPTAVVLGSTTT